MVVGQADYREKSKDGPTSTKCVEDIFSAIRWLRAHAKELGIDPVKIAVAGGSGSIHLPAAVFQLDDIRASGEDASIDPLPGAVFSFHPDPDVLDNAMMDRLQNGKLAPGQKMPPTVLYWGSRDAVAPFLAEFVSKSRLLNLPIDRYVSDGGVHGFYKFTPGLEATVAHMDEQLSKLGFLLNEPKAELPHKAMPSDYEQRIITTQQKWLERHNQLAEQQGEAEAGRSNKKTESSSQKISAAPDVSASKLTINLAPSRSWDANQDGKISKDEFKAPAQLFQNMDTDGDGFLIGKELAKLDSKLNLDKTGDTTWVVPPETSYHGVSHHTYLSKSMQTKVGYNIYLPDGYEKSEKRYPVIYHLHGSGGNESVQIDLSAVYHKAIEQKNCLPSLLSL